MYELRLHLAYFTATKLFIIIALRVDNINHIPSASTQYCLQNHDLLAAVCHQNDKMTKIT